MTEKDLERKIAVYAKSLGLLTYKFTSPARRAVPDRLFVRADGNSFYVEFKAPGKKPTPLQDREIARLKKWNVRVYVIDALIEGRKIIFDEHLESVENMIDM